MIKGFEEKEVASMNLRDFCETVNTKFVRRQGIEDTLMGKKGQLKSCQKGSGHWVLSRRKQRCHVGFSTILNTDLAANYKAIDETTDTTYATFFDMPLDLRRQLVRSYYELVCYVP